MISLIIGLKSAQSRSNREANIDFKLVYPSDSAQRLVTCIVNFVVIFKGKL